MKAFVFALIATAIISVGAGVALDRAGYSSGQVYKSDNVRLSD